MNGIPLCSISILHLNPDAALKAEFNNARSYDDALDIIRKYVDIAEC